MHKKKIENHNQDFIHIKQIFDSVENIILLIDPDNYKIVEANKIASEIYNIPPENFINKNFLELPKAPETEIESFQKVVSTGIKEEFDTVHLKRNNEEILLNVIASLFETSDKKLILYSAKEVTSKHKAQQKLIQSENRFRSLYEYNPLITFTIDSEGKIISVNKFAINELNYPENELTGNHISKLYHPEDEALINFQINQCLENPNKAFTWDLRLLTKTGKVLWVRVSSIAIQSIEGREEVIVVCDNITHQKETEKTLIDYAKSLQRMLDASPLGVLVYTLDEKNNLRLISTNESTEKILGIKSEDYLYRKIEEIFPSLPQQNVINNFRKIAKEGGNLLFQKIKYYDKNISGIYEYSAIQLAENTVAIFFIDVTEREKALELLRESELKYKTLFDSSNDAILLLKNEYFIEANQKALEIFGCSLEDLLNKTPVDFSPDYQEDKTPSKDSALEKIRNALNGIPQFFEWKHKRKDNSLFDAEVSLFLTEIKGEKFIQAIVRDITEKKKAQKQIAMFASAFKNISESVIIGDTQDNIIFVNDAFVKTYGYTKEEIIGKNVSLIRSNKNPSHIVKEILPATLKGGWKGELINVKKSGEEIIISLSTSPVYDEDGKLLALCGIVEDITERKRNIKQLAESEERFRSLVNNIAEAVVIVDWNGKILFANQSAAKLVNLDSPEKGVGRSITEFLHPSDIDRAIRLISFEIKDKSVTESFRIITADKNIKWVESISARITFQEQKVLLTTLRDITERIKTEEMLHLLTNALHSAANGVVITDHDGKIVWINQAMTKLTGYDENELIGKTTALFKSGLLPDNFYAKLWNTIKAGKVWRGELINKRKDGTLYDEEMTITPIFNDNHDITHFIAVKEDITERKKSEREIREAKAKAEEMNKLKSSFLANMSHELRTPLVGILGFAELLRSQIKDKELSEMAERIFISGKRLLETLNSILDLSRIEANKLEIKTENINVCRVVRESLMQFEAFAQKKNLYLKTEISDEEIIANLDERILRQILNNLINNAIKFTKKGGVTITVNKEKHKTQGFVVIKIKDTGIGISEENLPKIFEEFRQVSEGPDRKFEGTGLGLTLTKKFVEILGGKISVSSKINEGSIFTLELPIKVSEDTDLNQEEGEVTSEEVSFGSQVCKRPIKMLLVENDEASIEVTRLFLKNYCELDVALNGEQALKFLTENEYNLILMDINLGQGMSGIDVTRKIKSTPGYEKIPVIALTAYAMVGDKEEFLKAGCTHYLSKPFKKEQLLAVIEEALLSEN